MTTRTVSYTLPDDLPEQVKAAAARDGMSVSSWVARELRRALVAEDARRYAAWLADDSEVRAEIAAFAGAGAPLNQYAGDVAGEAS
jgi:plasmid stability protein